MPACHRCGTAFEASGQVSRGAACRSCNAWLRSCRNCASYDPKHKNECLEPEAEPVGDKEAGNFCEFFRANTRSGAMPAAAKPAEDPFDALFKK